MSRQGRVGQVFKMKGNISGQKKAGTEPHAIKDPDRDELLVANKDIKKATLNYCVDNLKRKSLDPDVELLVNLRKACVEEKLRDISNEPLDIEKSDFDSVIKKFK